MSLVASAHLAELSHLDVIDIGLDGEFRLNADFLAECIEALDEDPSGLGTVVQERIVARAAARGFACVNIESMALVALEIGAAEAEV